VHVLLLVLGAVVLGVVIGLLSGGSIRSLAEAHFRWWPLALAGLVLQVIPIPAMVGPVDRWLGAGLYALSYVLLFVFVAKNIRLPGFVVMGVAFALNALVISVNGGMPVSENAIRSVAGPTGDTAVTRLLVEGGQRHHLAGPGDVLRPLGDVIPVGRPVRGVLSVGDVMALVGAVWVVAGATRKQPAMPDEASVPSVPRAAPDPLPPG
jgi:hypothetical protein